MAGKINRSSIFSFGNNYWYRQGVVDRIYEIYSSVTQDGKRSALILPEVLANEGVELYSYAIYLFGSWENAVSETGFGDDCEKNSTNAGSEYWTPESVQKQIQLLNQNRFDLSAGFIKHVYPELFYYAKQRDFFGSWSNGLDEAGVDFKKLKSKSFRFWTLKNTLNAVIDYDFAYGNLQPIFIRQVNPSLYAGSRRYFKSWSETVSKAGLLLSKNLIKVAIQPLRNFVILEYLKKIMDALGTSYQMREVPRETNQLEQYGLKIPELEELPEYYLETGENKDRVYITSSYRSWGLGSQNRMPENPDEYTKIRIYYSVGEPRRWVNDKVTFIDLNQFYDELAKAGRDDIISDIGLLSRGGIPKPYMERYEAIMKSFKKSMGNQKKKK
jgi:hypothetical protein